MINKVYKLDIPKDYLVVDYKVKIENSKIVINTKFEYVPKVGETIKVKLKDGREIVCIFKSIRNYDFNVYCSAFIPKNYFGLWNSYLEGTLCKTTDIENISKAKTDEFANMIDAIMKTHNKTWDFDRNELVDFVDYYEFKFGDVVKVFFDNNNYFLCIFPDKPRSDIKNKGEYFFDIANIDSCGKIRMNINAHLCKKICKASEDEKNKLYSVLISINKYWNELLKSIETLRWCANISEYYYTVMNNGEIQYKKDLYLNDDNIRYDSHNYFEHELEAKNFKNLLFNFLATN